MYGVERGVWVEAVLAKFADVGVETLRDFVVAVLTINKSLTRRGHSRMHNITLEVMLVEVCEMLFGPKEGEDGRENLVPDGAQPLKEMLMMVSARRGMIGLERVVWVEAMRAKFADVGVEFLRDFIVAVLSINKSLT